MTDPWRYRCPAPERHASIETMSPRKGTYLCRECEKTYAELYDMKTEKVVSSSRLSA